LAARLKAEFATEVELIAAGGGLFEVSCNERVVYSKKQTGNFPNEDELVAALSS
jgi:selenoprotein W-related protein